MLLKLVCVVCVNGWILIELFVVSLIVVIVFGFGVLRL